MTSSVEERRAVAELVLREHVRVPGPVVWGRRLGVVPWPVRDPGPRCSCSRQWPCPIAASAEWQASTLALATAAILAGQV